MKFLGMIPDIRGHVAICLIFFAKNCYLRIFPIFANFLPLFIYNYKTAVWILMKFSVTIPDTHVHFGMVLDFLIFLPKNCHLQIFIIFGNLH